jgi:hypothetical protein
MGGTEGRQPVDDDLADPLAELRIVLFTFEDRNHDPLLAWPHDIERPPSVERQPGIARQQRHHDLPATGLGSLDGAVKRANP